MRRYQIGRGEANDAVINHPSVSRVHAVLDDLGDGQFLLTDMNSTYGTGIDRTGNWIQVQKAVVTQQDSLRFGDVVMAVQSVLSSAAAAETGRSRRPTAGAAAPAGRLPRAATTLVPAPRRRFPVVAAGVALGILLIAGGLVVFLTGGNRTSSGDYVAECVATGQLPETCQCHARVLVARLTDSEMRTYTSHLRNQLNMPPPLIAKVAPVFPSIRACR